MSRLNNSRLFRVYLPTECLACSSAFAVGYIDQANKVCCVTGLVQSPLNGPKSESSDVKLVGFWVNDACEEAGVLGCMRDLNRAEDRTLLRIKKRADCLHVNCCQPGISYGGVDSATEFIVVLYDLRSFLHSTTLLQLQTGQYTETHCDSTNLEIIAKAVARHQTFSDNCDSREDKLSLFSTRFRRRTISQCIADIVRAIPDYFLVNLYLRLAIWLSSLRFFSNSFVRRVLKTSSALCQIKRQHRSVLIDGHLLPSNCQKESPSFKNEKYRWLLDICLGLSLAYLLRSNDFIEIYADRFIRWTEVVAVEFERLLNWLMGVPAGLKVNEPLAYFLGNFFLYHIFLWKAYLRTLRPIWSDICYYGSLSGCFGLTVQLCLVQDLISMMTIHIYCFYVYAARLYSFQVLALSSLWQLFRGKKLNILRKRTDSALYDIDQLFTGTLMFTILLFTLPTTALFYVVFALLRLLVLSLQGVLSTVVSFINRVPVYWLFMRFLCPSSTAGHPHASVVQQEPPCIHFKLEPLSVVQLFALSAKTVTSDKVCENSWSCLGRKLLLGELIYPWIKASAKVHTA